MTKRVAILISGSGSNMERLIKSMTGDHPARPVMVISNRADAGGLARAQAAGVRTQVIASRGRTRDAFEADLVAAIEAVSPDYICLAGFMRILGAQVIARWPGRILNIHPSLLPLFKGLDTHARAISAGVAVHGCTVHRVTPDLDDGPILGQAVVPVAADDTAQTLAARVLGMEHRLYPAVLRRLAEGRDEPLALFP